MELFRINCVTCQAELSVRNEAIIGTIIGCPRCGSMVEVSAPEAEAATDASSPEVESPVVGPEVTASSSFLTWALCTTAIGLTFIAGLTWWVTSAEEPEPTVVARSPAPTMVGEEEATAPVDTVVEEEVVEETPEETGLSQPPSESKPVEKLARVLDPPTVVAETSADLSEQTVVDTPEQQTDVPVKVAVVLDPPRHVFNALDLDPESLDLESLDQEAETSEQPTIEVPSQPRHGNVMEPEISTLPVVRRALAPEEGIATRTAAEQFELQLPALEVQGMPLATFLQMMGRLSGAPITLNAEQLQMAGISAREPISIRVRDLTLDSILQQALAPLRLEHHYDGPHVIITREAADQVREIDYPLDDLISSPADSEQLMQWIEQLVEPDAWETSKMEIADGKLVVQQSQQVHYQLLAFLERLRMVRGLDTRSRFPIARLMPTPLHAAMAPRLSRSALFTFTQDTPLAEVVSHWQRELEVPLLVDWTALAELDLWPDTRIACAIDDRDWQQALTAVLEPLGLSWRVCCGGGIEISSLQESRVDLQLELYPLAELQQDDGKQLLSQLREYLSRVPTGNDVNDEPVLIYDSNGPSLFALLSAEAQRDTLLWLKEHKLFGTR